MDFDYQSLPYTRSKLRSSNHCSIKVSIITPYFNAHEYIKETCDCILSQTFTEFEWIIVNDGSTNQTSLTILEDIKNLDNRIRIIHKENGGLSSARNKGFEEAATEYVIPIDADDLIEPTYVEQCWWALKSYPEAAFAYTDTVGFGDHHYLWKKQFDVESLKKDNFLVATAMIKKQAWIEVCGYDETLRYGYEDWDFWLRLISKGHRPVHINSYGFWYRRRPKSMLRSLETDDTNKQEAKKKIDNISKLISTNVQPFVMGEIKFLDKPKRNVVEVLSDDEMPASSTDKRHVVLFIFPWLNMGGADKFNLDLIKGLNPDKFRIIICTTVPSEHKWQDQFNKITNEIYHLPDFLPVDNWPQFIYEKITKEQVNTLFVSNSEYGYNVLPLLKSMAKNTFKAVDYVHMEEKYWKDGGYARFSSDVSEYLDYTYVTSENLKKVLVEGYGREVDRVKVAYINVDGVNTFNPQLVEPNKIKRDNGKFNVLFPCRLHQQKRPYLAIQIIKSLIQEEQDISLWIVGDGPEEAKLKTIVDAEGLKEYVTFFGAKRDVRPYYRDADCTLICSIKEGLSLTAYESMAMATPVITSDVGGQKELVTEDAGFVVPLLVDEKEDFGAHTFSEEEISLYTKAIITLKNNDDLRNQMGQCARSRIVEKFLIEDMIKYFEKELVQVNAHVSGNFENPILANKVIDIYTQMLKIEQASNEIWKARCYFENLWEQEKEINRSSMFERNIQRMKKLYKMYKHRNK